MTSQIQEIVVDTTENTSTTMEGNSLAQQHWQELITATEIAAVQLKEDDAHTEVSAMIETTACQEKKYNDEDMAAKEDPGKTIKTIARKRVERKRKQAPKKSIIPKIQALVNANETSRTPKKRKAESYMPAMTFQAKEKIKISESAGTMTEKRQGCNNQIIKAQNNIMEIPGNCKLIADTIASSPDSQIDKQENNEAKVDKNSFDEYTTKRQKQAVDKLKVVPIERPRRSIRPVIPYGSEAAEQKVRNKKLIEISQGSGLPLGQIPHVLYAIDKIKTSDDVLKGLHKLIYGRMGSKHDIKNHIRAFSGFKIQTPLDEIVLKEKLEKWKIAGLKDMCHLFGLKSSGDKQKVVDRIYDFLKNPRDMTAPNEENGKGKSAKKKNLADKMKTIAVRRKTAKDIFNSEQRLIYKEKAENHSKTRAEIDSLLTEAWRSLTENDKKLYAEKAAEVNKNEFRQKKQNLNKNKAKQPEMVEDSDLSDEDFEDHTIYRDKINEQKGKQPKDADIINLISLSNNSNNLPINNKNNEDTNIKKNNIP